MRLSLSTSSSSLSSSSHHGSMVSTPTVREKEEIVRELADKVLPRCTPRPYVYNMIAALTKHLENSLMEEYAAKSLSDDEDDFDDSLFSRDDDDTSTTMTSHDEEFADFFELERSNSISSSASSSSSAAAAASRIQLEGHLENEEGRKKFMYPPSLPNRSRNTVEEREQDIRLLDRLLSNTYGKQRKSQKFIRHKLGAIKNQVQKHVQMMTAITSKPSSSSCCNSTTSTISKKIKTKQQQQQLPPQQPSQQHQQPQDAVKAKKSYLQILPLFEDRPYLYNYIVGQVRKLEQEAEEADQLSQSQRGRGQRQQLQPRLFRSLSTNAHHATASKKNSINKKKNKESSVCWKVEPVPTAQERWMDVMKLDEILAERMDYSVQEALESLKKMCTSQAKALQRKEAGKLLFEPFQEEEEAERVEQNENSTTKRRTRREEEYSLHRLMQ